MSRVVKWRRYPQGALAVAVACVCKAQTFDPFSAGWRFREVWGGRREVRCPRCLPASVKPALPSTPGTGLGRWR